MDNVGSSRSSYLRMRIKKHVWAVIFSVVVGAIYVVPYVTFISGLGDHYRGIPIMATANEDFYLARMQEILDGHPSLGSQVFYEYKGETPTAPPGGEFLYVLPTLLFGVSLTDTLIVSRFFLPALLFLLVYLLVFRLNEEDFPQNKITAIAGALFVTLGYDLIDYRTILDFFVGDTLLSTGFLVWARPVNPILGAIFLFSFLLFVTSLIHKRTQSFWRVFGASVFLALMINNYFFSWGIALSVLAFLILIYLIRKEYKMAGILTAVLPLGVLLSSPYWYTSWKASLSPLYEAAILRSGLFYTHYPLLNKLLIVALFFFISALIFDFFWKKKREIAFRFEEWHIISFAFLLGGIWAYSQQIITGRTVWPYHFVQYTIPLVIVVFMVTLFHMRKSIGYLWHSALILIIGASLLYGVSVQIGTYKRTYEETRKLQSYREPLDWLNNQVSDCVVSVSGEQSYILEGFILAFTHCNIYNSTWIYSAIPHERILHNYLTSLFFLGVTSDTIEKYLEDHPDEPRLYLFSNWQGLYKVKDFPDFSDEKLALRIQQLPEDYREFLSTGPKEALRKYRLDFLFSIGPLSQQILKQLPGTKLIQKEEDIHIYQFE
ncbi:MAG: hypothetical protein COV91_00950 [Candidatus Taylorbacteria bacterium CG11_big_fil_rev_8_21_14_0_20_46_11]|uniref:Glycosyltransferase RgtA/B/C/D-like domain-containing protein n=1 Tax=Candidatus Taylorbacteria bacterium CG11_big_fil_rev_8_21_14_0_20_46_11 TaxID=1975025 RepID=A0A2H0KCR3_9BACT|nr:MAG: hypothetical protein COV91_00950 [Candidatus Taylorbacteria bacterium CG11_big_fil_rev_8_21_14_0_20_46_11]